MSPIIADVRDGKRQVSVLMVAGVRNVGEPGACVLQEGRVGAGVTDRTEQLCLVRRGLGVCLFVNNSWCTMSNIKEVSRYFSPEVEYLMIKQFYT